MVRGANRLFRLRFLLWLRRVHAGSARATCLLKTASVTKQASSEVGDGDRLIGILRWDCGHEFGVVMMSMRRETFSQSSTGYMSADLLKEARCVCRTTWHASSDGSVGR